MPLATPYEKPTRLEALRYYRKVADDLPATGGDARAGDRGQRGRRGRRAALRGGDSSRRGGQSRVRHARAVVLAMGYYDRPNLLGVPGEDLPHVSHYYRRGAPVLPPAGGHRRREELRLRSGARAVSRRRARHARASRRDARRLGQVLGAPRHREPHQGGHHRRAVLNRGRSRSARRRRRPPHRRPKARRRFPPRACCCSPAIAPTPAFLRRAGVEVDADDARAAARSRHLRDATCRTCSSPAVSWPAGGPGRIFIENGRFHGEQVAQALAERLRDA